MKTKKILIVVHPGFAETLRNITSQIDSFQIDVISFKDMHWRGKKLRQRVQLAKKYDILHFFWGYAKIFDFLVYKYWGRLKIINHFIGTDLFHLINSRKKRLELRLCSKISKFIVVGHILNHDLNELNIKNEIVYIMNQDIKKLDYSFPHENRAIAYIPSTRKSFFQHQYLVKLAKDFPQVQFTWFPYKTNPDEEIPSNVVCKIYIEKSKVLEEMGKHKIFLRLAIHDGGAPLSLIEAMSIGRWVIWSFSLDWVNTVKSYDNLRFTFETLIQKEKPNKAAEDFVLDKFNMRAIVEGFISLYDKES